MKAVIMAGGSGTRLWPESRKNSPKQTKPFIDDKTLLQKTFLRLRKYFDLEDIWVTTNEKQAAIIKDQLPEIDHSRYSLEPAKCDTAAAIGLATVKLHAIDPESSMININSDAYIANEERFVESLKMVDKALNKHPEYLIGMGIVPTFPETGYGYIKTGDIFEEYSSGVIYEVERFVEKPDHQTAVSYLENGTYLWNPTLFCWRTGTMLSLFKEYASDIYAGLMEIHATVGTDNEQETIDRVYPTLRKTSIDYAIFEKAQKMAVLKADFGWSDVGSWSAVKDIQGEKGENVIKGDVHLINSENNLIYTDKFVAGIGLKNLLVVDTEDALLICDKNSSQDVKKIVQFLEENDRQDLL